MTWEDSGSGVSQDFAAWAIGYTSNTLESGTFVGVLSHNFGAYRGRSNAAYQHTLRAIKSYYAENGHYEK